jgi:hypothetical protein
MGIIIMYLMEREKGREREKRKREMIQFGLYNGRSLTIPSMFYIKEQVLNQDAE